MEDTLGLCKSITNGPFPAMHLWCLTPSMFMMDLGLAELASLTSTMDYTFVIPSLHSETLPAERIEEDPEDNIELHNELGILDHLEMRMQALDGSDEEDQDD